MAAYWKTKLFNTRKEMESWLQKNSMKYQITEIFVNNGFGVEYKDLKKA